MNSHVQALEARTLLSTVPVAVFTDLGSLKSDAAALRGDFRQGVPAMLSDAHAVARDLRALPHTAQNRGLIGKLMGDEGKAVANLRKDAAAILNAGAAKIGHTLMDAMHLAAHPTTPALQARLSADLGMLQSLDTSVAARFLADGQAAASSLGADLTALAAANPTATTLQADAAKATSDMTTLLSNLQSHFHTTQGNFQQLLTSLKTMV